MPVHKFPLPDLGEGLPDAEILHWLVTEGQLVAQNQPLVTVETVKAAVDIPAKWPGRVVRILHPEGTTVTVGTPIVAIDTDPATAGGVDDPAGGVDDPAGAPAGAAHSADPGDGGEDAASATTTERTAVLVGYGPRTTPARRRPRRTTPPAAPVDPAAPAPATEPTATAVPDQRAQSAPVLAKPPVRRLARDLGVDLRVLGGTGPAGSITRADVTAAAEAATATSVGTAVREAQAAREERIPITGVRKRIAEHVTASAFTAPHATVFLTVDMTRGVRALQRLGQQPDWSEVRITPLLLVAKAVLLAARRHPMINASWDEAAGEIVVKRYVNLGIAAATPRGLVVPNIKDADQMSLRELADAMTSLVRTAKSGRSTPADLTGGTFTITNVGVFGVDTGTPILPAGEAAILAFGAVREQPWVHRHKLRVRQVTTLALSVDHRLVDGELASRFLADVGAVLSDPEACLLAWG